MKFIVTFLGAVIGAAWVWLVAWIGGLDPFDRGFANAIAFIFSNGAGVIVGFLTFVVYEERREEDK